MKTRFNAQCYYQYWSENIDSKKSNNPKFISNTVKTIKTYCEQPGINVELRAFCAKFKKEMDSLIAATIQGKPLDKYLSGVASRTTHLKVGQKSINLSTTLENYEDVVNRFIVVFGKDVLLLLKLLEALKKLIPDMPASVPASPARVVSRENTNTNKQEEDSSDEVVLEIIEDEEEIRQLEEEFRNKEKS